MHFQYVVGPPMVAYPAPPASPGGDSQAELLRELVAVSREQLAFIRAGFEAQYSTGRWQAFLGRWAEEFPSVGLGCQEAVPHVERAFLQLLDEATQALTDEEADRLDNEFALSEFLDRYGMKLAQLGNVLNILGPLAEAARQTAPPPNEE